MVTTSTPLDSTRSSISHHLTDHFLGLLFTSVMSLHIGVSLGAPAQVGFGMEGVDLGWNLFIFFILSVIPPIPI